MHRIPVVVAALALAGCTTPKSSVPPETGSNASLPPDASTERDVGQLLSSLDARATRRKGFTAKYRVQADDSELTIRFAYLAPDRARIDVDAAGGTLTSCVDERGATLRAEGDGTTRVARFDANELGDLWTGFDAALDAAFPSTDTSAGSPPELGSGPILGFCIRPEPISSANGTVSVSVSWSKKRRSFLSWLAPTEWNRAHYVDLQKIEVSNGATTATLSAATGLILDVTCGDGFRATLLQSTDDVDPSEFAEPPAAAESDEGARWFASLMYAQQRATIYRRILRDARLADSDPDQLRDRFGPVFEALHRAIVRHHYRDWRREYSEYLERYYEEYEAWLTEIGSDATGLEDGDRDIDDSCLSLEKTLDAQRVLYVANVALMPADAEALESVTKELLKIERDAARDAYQAEITDPMLLGIDERLRAIRAAH